MKCYPMAYVYRFLIGVAAFLVLGAAACWALFNVYPYFCCAVIVLLPILVAIACISEREWRVKVFISESGVSLYKRSEMLFHADWDKVHTITYCYGTREAYGNNYYHADCYNVVISNGPISQGSDFEKRDSLNFKQTVPLENEQWMIYCNRGTIAQCEELMNRIIELLGKCEIGDTQNE